MDGADYAALDWLRDAYERYLYCPRTPVVAVGTVVGSRHIDLSNFFSRPSLHPSMPFPISLRALAASLSVLVSLSAMGEPTGDLERQALLGLTKHSHELLLGAPRHFDVMFSAAETEVALKQRQTGALRTNLTFRNRPVYWSNENTAKSDAFLQNNREEILRLITTASHFAPKLSSNRSAWCRDLLETSRTAKVRTEFADFATCLSGNDIGLFVEDSRVELDSIWLSGDADIGPEAVSIGIQYSCSACTVSRGAKGQLGAFRVLALGTVSPSTRLSYVLVPYILR